MRLSSPWATADRTLLVLVFAILVIGVVMLSSASSVFAFERYGNSYYFVQRQVLFGIVPGLLLAIIIFSLPFERIQALTPVAFYTSLILLIAVFLPGIGEHLGRAQRWIRIGSFLLQPSEIVKLTSILYCAQLFQNAKSHVHSLTMKNILFLLAPLIIVAVLVMIQPDMGTTFVIVTTVFGMVFLSGVPLRPLLVLCSAGVIAATLLVASSPYRRDRVMTFLYPSTDVQGQSYHVNQAMIGIASGGLWGQGLGKSIQKFQYLPEVASDSLFAIMAEELGFIRVLFILAILAWVIVRCFRIGRNNHNPFASSVCIGIGIWLAIQSMINIAANIGLLPFTGVPLPFLSHGGTSMVILLTSIALVAKCASPVRAQEPGLSARTVRLSRSV